MPYLLTYWYTNCVVRFTAIFIASKIPMIITIKMIYHLLYSLKMSLIFENLARHVDNLA